MRGWRAGKGRGSRRAPGGRRPGGNLRPHLGEACLELIGRAVVALLGSLYATRRSCPTKPRRRPHLARCGGCLCTGGASADRERKG